MTSTQAPEDAQAEVPQDQTTFTEEVLGRRFLDLPWMKRLAGLDETTRVIGISALVGAALFLPALGAVGLWDCWETHYGEVARMMVHRRDYVFPYWESAWFFSKPPLTMWLMAVGMLLAGTNDGIGPGYGALSWPAAIALGALGLALCAAPALGAVQRRLGAWRWAAGAAGVVALLAVVVRGPFLESAQWAAARASSGADGPLAIGTEWGMRLPFALGSIAALALLALAVTRVAGLRAGLTAAVALATMPLYFLVTRQAVTDTPFVSLLIAAMSCAIIGQLDEKTTRRSAWWYGFYACCGFAVFAKGLLGAGIPAAVLLLYAALCVMPWDAESLSAHLSWLLEPSYRAKVRRGEKPMPFLWGQCYRMRLGTGLLLFAAIIGPWFATLFLFEGVDDEGKRFWYRFLIHDHFARLASGVHTTTPGGTFIYFIEQGGFGMFPWVALLPGGFALVARTHLRSKDRTDHLALLATVWAVGLFTLLAFSATKFHHYILPVLPPLAILIALFADRLWREGPARHAVSLIAGLSLFALIGQNLSSNPKAFTDLFVYNYDRPYPMTEVAQKAMTLFGRRTLFTGDVLTLLLLAFGGFLALEGWKKKTASARAMALALVLCGLALLLAMASGGRLSPTLFLGLALSLVAIFLGNESGKAKDREKADLQRGAAAVGVAAVALIVTALRRGQSGDQLQELLSQQVNPKAFLGMLFLVGGGLAAIAALQKARTMMFASYLGMALVLAGWFNWFHWADLAHHWTQRDQFWRYYAQRKPGEPIVAFLMNWRGETFYSRNEVKQIRDNPPMRLYAQQPGRKWALVEHYRLGVLKNAVGLEKTVTVVDRDLNNKFVLVTID
jgi:4-amino-4-deoxy-L-arabinose transferase-like glycosyltransferase